MNLLVRLARAAIDAVSAALHPLTKRFSRDRLRILCYHRVYRLGDRSNAAMNQMCVDPAAYEEQMAWLAGHGYHVMTLGEVHERFAAQEALPPRTVVITFDDGYRDNIVNALPALERHGLKATFFLATDYIGADSCFPWLKMGDGLARESTEQAECWRPMTEEDIGLLVKAGHGIGSHTRSHAPLASLDDEAAADELKGSLERVRALAGEGPACFCYPFGSVSAEARRRVVEAGYDISVSSEGGSNSAGADRHVLRRLIIDGTDPLSRFVRKVDGAYDWWYGWLLPKLRRRRP